MSRKALRYVKRISGYVWCHKLGEIHARCIDPYDYGPPERHDDEDLRCNHKRDHVFVYRVVKS